MNLTALIGLVNILSSLILGSYVFARNPRKRKNQAYFFFGLSVGLYSLGYFFWGLSATQVQALAAFKILVTGIVAVNSSYLEFVDSLLSANTRRRKVLWASHCANIFFIVSIWLGWLFSEIQPRNHWGFWPIPRILFYPFFCTWALEFYYGLLSLRRGYLNETGHTATQLRWVFIATAVGYFGGSTNWLPWFNVDFPPHLNLLVSAYIAILAYAIVRHRLLDIEVIIKRTLVFAGLLAMVMAVVAVVSAVVNGVIARSFAIPPNMVAVGSSLLVVVVFDPTRQFLIRVTDRFLFQKKSEIKDILNRLSESVVTIFDLDQIGHTILSTLGEALRLESGVIILQNKKDGNYRLLEHFGIVDDNLSGSIQGLMSDTTIGDYFAVHNRTILSLDHVDKQTAIPAAVSHWLQVTKARVCVPLFISEEQFGLMVLGKKKSDQEFSQDEIDFFPAIATQTSLALRNALLIETVVEEREEKVKAQHEAKRVHYAELLAHEVKNAVTAADLQARSLYEQVVPKFKLIQKKFFSESLPPVAIKEYEKMCQKITDIGFGIQDRCKKIRVITKTAQHHLSSDLSIFEEIYIKMLWEDAITESCVKNVTFDFHGPADKDFYAFGNPVLLQRVFINLIKNADDAMMGQADKRVALFCDFREVDSNQVTCFRFQDNGPGFQKESTETIFHRGFSTKPKPKRGDVMASGLGYGLYSCKENIEEFHHGKMWAETPEGGGACFVFWIPMEHKAGI